MTDNFDKPLSKGASLLRLKEKVERRRWMTNIFFGDVWGSLNHTSSLESDVQLFLDDNPEVGELKRSPIVISTTNSLGIAPLLFPNPPGAPRNPVQLKRVNTKAGAHTIN